MTPQSRTFHCYIHRHLFHGDSCIGKVDVRTKTVFLLPEFAELSDEARGHVARMLGFPVKLQIGLEGLEMPPVPVEFPAEIWECREPGVGDLTPALVAYAREHFPPAEFRRRYLGRLDLVELDSGLAGKGDLQPSGLSGRNTAHEVARGTGIGHGNTWRRSGKKGGRA